MCRLWRLWSEPGGRGHPCGPHAAAAHLRPEAPTAQGPARRASGGVLVAACRWRRAGGGVPVAVCRWRCVGGGVPVAVCHRRRDSCPTQLQPRPPLPRWRASRRRRWGGGTLWWCASPPAQLRPHPSQTPPHRWRASRWRMRWRRLSAPGRSTGRRRRRRWPGRGRRRRGGRRRRARRVGGGGLFMRAVRGQAQAGREAGGRAQLGRGGRSRVALPASTCKQRGEHGQEVWWLWSKPHEKPCSLPPLYVQPRCRPRWRSCSTWPTASSARTGPRRHDGLTNTPSPHSLRAAALPPALAQLQHMADREQRLNKAKEAMAVAASNLLSGPEDHVGELRVLTALLKDADMQVWGAERPDRWPGRGQVRVFSCMSMSMICTNVIRSISTGVTVPWACHVPFVGVAAHPAPPPCATRTRSAASPCCRCWRCSGTSSLGTASGRPQRRSWRQRWGAGGVGWGGGFAAPAVFPCEGRAPCSRAHPCRARCCCLVYPHTRTHTCTCTRTRIRICT